MTTLVNAAADGDLVTVNQLLANGADPSFNDNAAFKYAVINNHLNIIDRLLEDSRVQPGAQKNFALRLAVEQNRMLLFNRLIQDKRVDPSRQKNLSVMMAIALDRVEMTKKMLADDRVNLIHNRRQHTFIIDGAQLVIPSIDQLWDSMSLQMILLISSQPNIGFLPVRRSIRRRKRPPVFFPDVVIVAPGRRRFFPRQPVFPVPKRFNPTRRRRIRRRRLIPLLFIVH